MGAEVIDMRFFSDKNRYEVDKITHAIKIDVTQCLRKCLDACVSVYDVTLDATSTRLRGLTPTSALRTL